MFKNIKDKLQTNAEEFYIRKKLAKKDSNPAINYSKVLGNVNKILVIPSPVNGGILNSAIIVKKLKDRYPKSEIRVSVPNNWASVVSKFIGVDSTIGSWNSDSVWSDRYNSQIKAVSEWRPDLLVRLGSQMSIKDNYSCVIADAKLRLCYQPRDLTSAFWNITLVKKLTGLSDFRIGTALLEAIGIKDNDIPCNRIGAFKNVFDQEYQPTDHISIAIDADKFLNVFGKKNFNEIIETLENHNYKIVMVMGLARPSNVSYLMKQYGSTASIHSATDMLSIGSVLLRCDVALCGIGELLHWANAVGTPTICLGCILEGQEKAELEEEGIFVISSNRQMRNKLEILLAKLDTILSSISTGVMSHGI
jgi:hypothetical protein